MNTRTIPFLFILLLAMFACHKEPDLTLVEETVLEGSVINAFTTDGDWEVEVISSDTSRVELIYSKCFEKGISGKLVGNKLLLALSYSEPFPSGATMKARVYTKEISSISLDYYSTAVFKGDFSSSELYMVIANHSSCSSINTTMTGDCKIMIDKSSMLSDCQITCTKAIIGATNSSRMTGVVAPSDSLIVELNNNSRFVNYQAEPQAVKARIGAASLMNITQTTTQNLDIEIVASEASVNVVGHITGSLSDVSTLYYKGSPDMSGLDVSSDSETIQL